MSLTVEFMKFVEEQPNQTADMLLDKVLLKCRQLLGAEAGTIFLIEEQDDGATRVRPTSLQNDAADMSRVELALAVDKDSLAGYVAATGETVFVDDSYNLAADSPFKFNHTIDRISGYRTVSVLAFPLRTFTEDVIGVVQLINRRLEDGTGPAPFEMAQVELIHPFNQLVGRAIQRTVMLDQLRALNGELERRNGELEAKVAGYEAAAG